MLLIKKINKYGQVGIPKQVQKQIKIQDGDFLCIYYHKDSIVVEKRDHQNQNNQFNQCIFSNGRVSIPIELRRIHKIKIDAPITMEVSNKKIVLNQDKIIIIKSDVG